MIAKAGRVISVVVLILCLGTAVGSWKSTAALTTHSGMGLAQVSGPVQVDVSLTPDILQPGDTAVLTLQLANPGQLTRLPQIQIQLPAGLALTTNTLPSGMTANVAANTLNWLPVLTANGGQQTHALPVRVISADAKHPQQQLTVQVTLDGETFDATADFWLGVPPQIERILSPPQVAMGQPFRLRLESDGSEPLTPSWELEDGRLLSEAAPQVRFTEAGDFVITATLQNPVGTVTATRTIAVVPHPAAQLRADDASVSAGQAVTFINESGGAPPLTYRWEFGDGVTADTVNPTHQYSEPGTYQVHLTVSNSFGEAEAFYPVTVGQPPTAFMTLPESVPAGQAVSGQASGDASVQFFRWETGDGRFYDGPLLHHTYTETGNYYVLLTATNEFGGTAIGQWLRVEPGTFVIFLPTLMQQLLSARPAISVVGSDPLAPLALPDVPLEGAFVMTPLPLPADLSPAEKLFVYINEARAQFDLAPLTRSGVLNQAALKHATDMAANAFAAHTGSDGSTPADRFLQFQYGGGYGGEATAWGFEYPYQAVEFWVNSPAHRRIILNEYATDVGVGYTQNFSAPSVWYWTAEFGNRFAAPPPPLLRVQAPQTDVQVLNTDPVTYGWNWPTPLAAGQAFMVQVNMPRGVSLLLGPVTTPSNGTYYTLTTDFLTHADSVGEGSWQVVLVDGRSTLVASEPRAITVLPDPTLPTPTPTPAITTTVIAPTATPPATMTPTAVPPTATPRPNNPGPPPLVTATPNP